MLVLLMADVAVLSNLKSAVAGDLNMADVALVRLLLWLKTAAFLDPIAVSAKLLIACPLVVVENLNSIDLFRFPLVRIVLCITAEPGEFHIINAASESAIRVEEKRPGA